MTNQEKGRLNARPLVVLGVVMSLLAVAPAKSAPGDTSPDGVWVEVDRTALGEVRDPLPTAFRAYRLNLAALTEILDRAPREVPGRGTSPAIVTMPLPDGTFAPVAVELSPVLGPDLSAQYPSIRTFVFHGTEDTAISGRISLNALRFQAILRPSSDFARITPITTSAGTFYLSFLNRNRTDNADDFPRGHDHPRDPDLDEPPPMPRAALSAAAPAFNTLGLESGSQLREYRLAVAPRVSTPRR